jgi:myo-inositol-1(or 4)-monophosphatase
LRTKKASSGFEQSTLIYSRGESMVPCAHSPSISKRIEQRAVAVSPSVDLGWLRPELDRCRELIARNTAPKRWTKSSSHGAAAEVVTDIDLAIERLLIDAIGTRVPTATLLSEESHTDPAALANDTCFVIDPIDGTEEFAAGRPNYAISIALFHSGSPVAAVLDLPAKDQRFECSVGTGTQLNGATVELSRVQHVSEARVAVSASQLDSAHLRPFWTSMDAAELRPTPAFAAKFAGVLAGECDAALYLPVRPHRTAIWDYAAAALLLDEAGGGFTSIDGIDLLHERPFLYTGGWVASPPALREELLALARGRVRYGE